MTLAAAFGFFLVLALVKTYPLVWHLTTHVPIFGDSPYHVGWILAWGAHALVTSPGRLFDAPLAYPLERSFAFSEHMLGLQPFYLPVYLATGNPTAAYNTVFVLSFALSGFAAFVLVRGLLGRSWPALVAGTLFGFAPFRFGHINHLHILAFFWAPLALLFLDRFLRARRSRDLAAFVAGYCLQALSSIQLAVLTTVAVALYGGWSFVVDRSLRDRAVISRLAAAAGVALAVLVPPHLPYLEVQRRWGSPWTLGTLVGGSADLRDFLVAPPWVNDVYLALSRRIDAPLMEDGMLFPGLVLPALAGLGVVGRVRGLSAPDLRRLRALFGVVAAGALVLALGPFLRVAGWNTRLPLPYWVLYHAVPGWDIARIPSRFVLLATLAATPLAAVGVLSLGEWLSARAGAAAWRRSIPAATAVVVIAAALAELGAKPLPLDETPIARTPTAYRWLAAERPGPVLEVPLGIAHEMRYLALNTLHWLPVVSPRGSFAPAVHDQLKAGFERLPAGEALEQARALGVRAIVLHTDRLAEDDLRRWQRRARTDPALELRAAFPPHLVYTLAPVPLNPTLTARLAVAPQLPAAATGRVGLALSTPDGRPWAHPRPHGRSVAVVEWTESATGRAAGVELPVALPLVVGGRAASSLPVRVKTPMSPGRYRLRVRVPALGLDTGTADVNIAAGAMPTSLDPAAPLSVTLVAPGGANSPVAAHDFVTLDITARNTGPSAWLSKATHNDGEVLLRWRWLQNGTEQPRLTGLERVHHDVYPGQDHPFHLIAAAPARPARYTLEITLAVHRRSGLVAVPGSPIRLPIDVFNADRKEGFDEDTEVRGPRSRGRRVRRDRCRVRNERPAPAHSVGQGADCSGGDQRQSVRRAPRGRLAVAGKMGSLLPVGDKKGDFRAAVPDGRWEAEGLHPKGDQLHLQGGRI